MVMECCGPHELPQVVKIDGSMQCVPLCLTYYYQAYGLKDPNRFRNKG